MSYGNLSLSAKIFLAMVSGLIIGLFLQYGLESPDWVNTWLTGGIFFVIGKIFISLLKMLVVPLVFVSLVTGTSALADPSTLGRIGLKTIGLYLITTGIAVSLALFAAVIFQPGIGAEPAAAALKEITTNKSFVQVLVDIVPTNPVSAMANGDMLPIIVFAVMLGIAITHSGKAGVRIAGFFSDLNDVIMKLVTFVMKMAPIGVFSLILILGATLDFAEFAKVAKYIVLVLAVLLIHGLIVYPTMLSLLSGLNPITFLKKMRPAMMFAFSTASSNATIPVTMETVEKRIGVNNRVSSFTIPMGATINMDGTAIMQGIATGFIAQFYGIDLSLSQYLMIVVMIIMASIGTAGVPSVGLVILAGVLANVGLPIEGIALILGVDRLLDMTRTAVNVTGDATVTTIVAKSENELDLEIFHDPKAGMKFEKGEATH
ncbi:MAG: dicarboxylate/amino acid:cation symporter [Xanthomonadales bacterium]|nr:dicarboxylate/amino acid:cation symporter [Xanthomonadales bacterium]